jgi:hypothetical protein
MADDIDMIPEGIWTRPPQQRCARTKAILESMQKHVRGYSRFTDWVEKIQKGEKKSVTIENTEDNKDIFRMFDKKSPESIKLIGSAFGVAIYVNGNITMAINSAVLEELKQPA